MVEALHITSHSDGANVVIDKGFLLSGTQSVPVPTGARYLSMRFSPGPPKPGYPWDKWQWTDCRPAPQASGASFGPPNPQQYDEQGATWDTGGPIVQIAETGPIYVQMTTYTAENWDAEQGEPSGPASNYSTPLLLVGIKPPADHPTPTLGQAVVALAVAGALVGIAAAASRCEVVTPAAVSEARARVDPPVPAVAAAGIALQAGERARALGGESGRAVLARGFGGLAMDRLAACDAFAVPMSMIAIGQPAAAEGRAG